MNSRIICLLFTIPMLCLASRTIYAQDSTNQRWKFLIEPYLMFPYMNGSAGVGQLPNVSVDAGPSDIFSNLSVAAMLYGEANTQNWAIGSDIIYMNLKDDVETGAIVNDGFLQAKQFAWEISGLRKVTPWLELGVGGRLNSLEAAVDLTLETPNGISDRGRSLKETWFDPVIITRINNPSEEKLLYQFRGDIGGFGMGSQLTWQIQAYVGYKFSQLFQLSGGYRIISIDYEKGANENRFMYDVNTSGPVFRLGFNL